MNISDIGYIFIIFGFILIFFPKIYLTSLVVLFMPFSATAVINFTNLDFGMQPYHFLGILMIIKTLISSHNKREFKIICKNYSKILASFLAFVFFSFLSIIYNNSESSLVIHLIHLLFGFSVFFCIIYNINDCKKLIFITKSFVYGISITSFLGLFQLFCFFYGFDYPKEILNNSVGKSSGGFEALLADNSFLRVSSVATEPSFLVRCLVPALLFYTIIWTRRSANLPFVFSKNIFSVTYFLPLITTVVSTSSIGYLALTSVFGVILFSNRCRIYMKILITVMVFYLIASIDYNSVVYDIFDTIILNKSSTSSGMDRGDSILDALNLFYKNLLFGVGPGGVTSHDLFVKLFSNYGIFGAFAFLYFIYSIFFYSYRTLKSRSSYTLNTLTYGYSLAVSLLLLMDILAGISYQYGIFWTLLGLLIGSTRINSSIVIKH